MQEIKQVGITRIYYIKTKNRSKFRHLGYHEVEYDKLGWADPNYYLPLAFDLVRMITLTALGQREYIGWWTGQNWFCRKSKSFLNCLKWKKIKDIFED